MGVKERRREQQQRGKVSSPWREIHFRKQPKSMQHFKTQIGVCQRANWDRNGEGAHGVGEGKKRGRGA